MQRKTNNFIRFLVLILLFLSVKNPAQQIKSSVEPLIQNQWSTFTWPYNAYLPYKPGGEQVGNACGYTSIARILHYFQFPVNGTEVIDFTDDFGVKWDCDLTSLNLNYFKMPPILSHSASENEYSETAKLFLAASAVGESIGIGYSDGPSKIPEAMVRYFNFKSGARLVNRWEYSKEEWIELFKTELSNGRPIIVGGRTKDSPAPWEPGSWSGHWWICDGYNESDEFYCDYAFNGIRGYYDIDNLGEVYTEYNQAIIGLEPDLGNKSISISSPDKDEVYYNDGNLSINWQTENIANLTINYSKDNGYTWNNLTNGISASSGTFSWALPAINSSQCRIKLTDVSDINIYKVSDLFTITNPNVAELSLNYPNGGEYLISGKTYSIIWESQLVQNLKIEYTTNDGASWNQIASNINASDNEYNWTIPDSIQSELCKIRISSTEDTNLFDVSDNPFEINALELIGGPYYPDENTVLLLSFEGSLKNSSDLSADGIASDNGLSYSSESMDKLGQCLQFNSSQHSRVTIPHNQNLSLIDNWTVEAWVKFTSYNTSAYSYILSKPAPDVAYESNYAIAISPYWGNVFFGFYFSKMDDRIGITGDVADLNTWYHIALVRNSTNSTLSFIVHNQKREEIFSQTINYSNDNVLLNSDDLCLGSGLNGYLDEVRISNVVRDFKTITAPGKAASPTPANSAKNIELTPTLTWKNGNDAEKIDLYFGTSNTPTTLVLNNVNAIESYTTEELEPNTTYYWKIVCKNFAGNTEGDVWSFTTLTPNQSPKFTKEFLPTDNSNNISLTPTLSWNCSDPDGDNILYDVYLGTTINPPLVKSGFSQKLFATDTLLSNTIYYWKIIATDDFNNSAETDLMSFTTMDDITGIIDMFSEIPNEFKVDQNYPNPFNPTTMIKFGIPNDSKVVVKVYDILGRYITTLVNQQLSAGYHLVNWNASYMANGTYIYQVIAGEYAATKKMVLLK